MMTNDPYKVANIFLVVTLIVVIVMIISVMNRVING